MQTSAEYVYVVSEIALVSMFLNLFLKGLDKQNGEEKVRRISTHYSRDQ